MVILNISINYQLDILLISDAGSDVAGITTHKARGKSEAGEREKGGKDFVHSETKLAQL